MSQTRPFELRAGMQLMQRLLLLDPEVDALRPALEATVAQAPGMFRGALVAVDLAALDESAALPDFAALGAVLRGVGIVPAGVCNAGPSQAEAAAAAGWPLLGEQRERSVEPETRPAAARAPARVVTQPVRSGQQVHSPGDLILLAPVSAGAEVLADGSIHVHAALRGRALAGIRGDETATISCTAFHAELVAVAGHYRTLDEPEGQRHGGPAYVHLDAGQLRIETA